MAALEAFKARPCQLKIEKDNIRCQTASQQTSDHVYYICAGAASQGPSNLAIMAVAMSSGRRTAIAIALGVAAGLNFGGILVGLGLSAALVMNGKILIVLEVVG